MKEKTILLIRRRAFRNIQKLAKEKSDSCRMLGQVGSSNVHFKCVARA